MSETCECPARKALAGLLWPNVPSADDMAILVAMVSGGTDRTIAAMKLVDSLRIAQSLGAAALAAPCPCEGLPEIPCCPPHEAMWKNGTTKPLDNCFVCIRNERDELRAELEQLKSL